MRVNIYRTGGSADAKRALITARVMQAKLPGQPLDAVNGVQINEVRFTAKSGTMISTYGLASCIAVTVVNVKTGFPFAALAHCQTIDDSWQLLKDVADVASQRHGQDLKLQVVVCSGYMTSGTAARKLHNRDGLLMGVKLGIQDDDRYLPTVNVSHFGLTRPHDGNFYSMLLACRDDVYDIILANRVSLDATPGARSFFENTVGKLDFDSDSAIAAERAKEAIGSHTPRVKVRLGCEML